MLNQINNKYNTNLTLNFPNAPKTNNINRERRAYTKEDSVRSSAYRTIRNIKEIIQSNFNPNIKFLTLTVKTEKNSLDREEWKRRVINFIRRLTYWYKHHTRHLNMNQIEYFCVFEKHKDKESLHAHLLIDMPYIPCRKGNNILEKIWGMGFVSVSSLASVKGFVNDLKKNGEDSKELYKMYSFVKAQDYTCKYLTKNIMETRLEDPSVKGGNLYLCSKGWKANKEKEILEVKDFIKVWNKCYQKGYLNDLRKRFCVISKIIDFTTEQGFKIRKLTFIIPTKFLRKVKEELFSNSKKVYN